MVPPLNVLAAAEDALAGGIELLVASPKACLLMTRSGSCGWCASATPSCRPLDARHRGPGRMKIGFLPDVALMPGPLGVMSKSGTLSYEICYRLGQRGVGQSLWIGVGGDPVKGARFADLVPLFQSHPETEAVLVIGEIGGTEEEELAEALSARVSPSRCSRCWPAPPRRQASPWATPARSFMACAARPRRRWRRLAPRASASMPRCAISLRTSRAGWHRRRGLRSLGHSTSQAGPNTEHADDGTIGFSFKLTDEQKQIVGTVRELTQSEFKPRGAALHGRHVPLGEHAAARRNRRARHGGAARPMAAPSSPCLIPRWCSRRSPRAAT